MRSKYIFGELKASVMSTQGAVIFPEFCDHEQMAALTCTPGSVTSAGFVTILAEPDGNVLVELWGNSVSLKLEANPAHTKAVRRTLGLD